MKAFFLIGTLGLITHGIFAQSINTNDLKITCGVLYRLTDKAIDENRKDLIAIYYNTYQAIRTSNVITDECDQYFKSIKSNYGNEIGNWKLGMDFPPKYTSSNDTGFTHKEVETLAKLKEFGITAEDLDHFVLLKKLQKNTVDLKLLKTTNSELIKKLNENLGKLKLDKIDHNKLNSLSNENLKIEQFQQLIDQQ